MVKRNWVFIAVILIAPVALSALVATVVHSMRSAWMETQAQNGALAIYDGGVIHQEDLFDYIHHPPTEESPILRALELTPEDVIGLDREQPDFFDTENGQLLIKRILKHLALIDYLHQQAVPANETALQSQVKAYRERLLRDRVEAQIAEHQPAVSQEEMLAFYTQNPQRFHQVGERYARHIMIPQPAGEEADSVSPQTIHERLRQGEDFERLVRFSQSASAEQGGRLGWLMRGESILPFDQALWALEIGEVTGPIAVNGNWHFIQLLDSKPEGMRPFDQCREEIYHTLRDQKSLAYQYSVLGLAADNIEQIPREKVQTALLQKAYAENIDEDPLIQKKAAAFEKYYGADLIFRDYVERYAQQSRSGEGNNSTWLRESSTAERLLDEMNFHLFVKLHTPDWDT